MIKINMSFFLNNIIAYPNVDEFINNVVGQKINNIKTRGKFIVIELDNF